MELASPDGETPRAEIQVTLAGPAHLVVVGDLDTATSPRLREAIATSAGNPGGLVIDLGGVGFIDSAGVAALLEARDVQAEAGGRVTLMAPLPQVIRLLTLLDLADQFDLA